MLNNNDVDTKVVFEYTGVGCVVPKDVAIVRFHPSVAEVEYDAFRNCIKLRKVIFNEGLQKIGWEAFYGCKSLSSIKLPSTVIEIGGFAFKSCKQLREVLFNDGLHKIGWQAFYNCASLSSITLPSTVIEIGSAAFYNCSNLRDVILNDGLQKIGLNAFYRCTSLPSITFPSTITEIGCSAFDHCNNLREVMFHEGFIGFGAFDNCASLERFTFPAISTRLDTLIRTAHWEEIENEVDEVRGAVETRGVIERSDDELFVLVTQSLREGGRNWNPVKQSLDKIVRLISYYELKEATSMLELALWKFKLDQVDKANPIPRKKCRMDVPGPVKDIIMQYFPYECLRPVPDIQSSSSESDDEESSDGYLI